MPANEDNIVYVNFEIDDDTDESEYIHHTYDDDVYMELGTTNEAVRKLQIKSDKMDFVLSIVAATTALNIFMFVCLFLLS